MTNTTTSSIILNGANIIELIHLIYLLQNQAYGKTLGKGRKKIFTTDLEQPQKSKKINYLEKKLVLQFEIPLK